jgi:hypothetical protein
VVGACVYPVEDNPVFAERGEEKGMDNHDVRLGSPIAANRALIGDDDQCSTNPLRDGPCFQGEVDRLEITRLDDVAVDDTPIQNSISIQEQSRSRRRTSGTAYVTEHW